jgi:hypothetical protein
MNLNSERNGSVTIPQHHRLFDLYVIEKRQSSGKRQYWTRAEYGSGWTEDPSHIRTFRPRELSEHLKLMADHGWLCDVHILRIGVRHDELEP